MTISAFVTVHTNDYSFAFDLLEHWGLKYILPKNRFIEKTQPAVLRKFVLVSICDCAPIFCTSTGKMYWKIVMIQLVWSHISSLHLFSLSLPLYYVDCKNSSH